MPFGRRETEEQKRPTTNKPLIIHERGEGKGSTKPVEAVRVPGGLDRKDKKRTRR